MFSPISSALLLKCSILASLSFTTLLYAQENPVAVSFRTSAVPVLAASDSVGVIPQANWNDVNLGPVGGLSGGVVFPSQVLLDNSGVSSGITLATSYTTGYAANNAVGTSADEKMMAGALYLKATDIGAIQFSGISTNLQSEGYDVIVYFEATTHPRDISVVLGSSTAQGLDASAFSGTFIQGTGATVDSNYLRFTGLSAASFSMTVSTVTSASRAGVTGIQIVPTNYIPLIIHSFTASPQVVNSPTVTSVLGWNVSGATSVFISPGVGSVSASGTTIVTPGGDQTYTLTATNAAGATTRDLTIRLINTNVPNIVIFIVDDFGWQDSSYQFWDTQTQWNQLYRTPGMERLSTQGRAFTCAYASGPVCTASRISILLGQAPVRHGTTFISGHRGYDGDPNIYSANQDNAGLVGEKQTRTLPTLLSSRGYRSIIVGKAHFGPHDPLSVGFDRNRYGGATGSPNGNGSDSYHQILPNGSEVHLSEALTLAANEEIDDAVTDGVPFFLYMSHYAVHTPILEDSRFTANYPTVSGTTRAMCTLIEGIDKSLEDLLDHLEAKGIAEKTLIIFTSDHGGYSYRSGSSYYNAGPSPTRKFNWPLRGGKNDAYEGGLRIPMFVTWAKHDATEPFQQALPITQGSTESRPVIHADLLPTILEITGHSSDIPSVVDGKSFSGYITGDSNFVREEKFFWHAPNFWVSGQAKPDSAMRDGKYKLIYTYNTGDGVWELFDLDADIGEQTNLMDTLPEIGVRMARELIIYLESENANYPILKSTNQELLPVMPSQASLVDLDGDGLTDAQEDINRNGIVDPGETNPGNENTDGDNVNDGDEARIGKDPLDANSFFKLEQIVILNGDVQITWPSAPNATFTIQKSTDLSDWSTIIASGITASTGISTSYNLGSPSEVRSFYRVELVSE